MSFEFGKDLGLMVQVVKRGLAIGVGDEGFWGALSKPQPGLWREMRHFLYGMTSAHICQVWPENAPSLHRREPDLDTLDQAVREGREHEFGKKEWTLLAENEQVFRALIGYLRLSPPFSTEIVVEYERLPKYVQSSPSFGEYFPRDTKGGMALLEMSIYINDKDAILFELEKHIATTGWRFADQYESGEFAQQIHGQVRPWALLGSASILGLGSRRNNPNERDWLAFPKILGQSRELDVGGLFVHSGGGSAIIKEGERLLIVRNKS